MAGLAIGASLVLAASVVVLGALGAAVAKVVPLTTFQAACLMLALALAGFAVVAVQDLRGLLEEALLEEEEEPEDEEDSPPPHLHPVLPFPDLVTESGTCACGSNLPYEECCGRPRR